MRRVIVIAADASSPGARRLCLQVEHLTDHPALPEEIPVEPDAPLADRVLESRQHREPEEAIGRNVLVAAETTGNVAAIERCEKKQAVDACNRLPQEVTAAGGCKRVARGDISWSGVAEKRINP